MGNKGDNKKKTVKNEKKPRVRSSVSNGKKANKVMAERGALAYGAVEKNKQKSALGLIVGLIVVLTFSVLFVGAVSGWFDDSMVVLDKEYLCNEECEMMDLTVDKYEELVKGRASFVVFVDQDGCTTADKLRGFVQNWADDNGVRVYKMMFSDARKTSLHDYVRYYPSVAVVSKGKPVAWLRADEDEDSDAYNREEAFKEWIGKYL